MVMLLVIKATARWPLPSQPFIRKYNHKQNLQDLNIKHEDCSKVQCQVQIIIMNLDF